MRRFVTARVFFRRTAIVWMRGAYKANQGEWYSSVVAAIIPPR